MVVVEEELVQLRQIHQRRHGLEVIVGETQELKIGQTGEGSGIAQTQAVEGINRTRKEACGTVEDGARKQGAAPKSEGVAELIKSERARRPVIKRAQQISACPIEHVDRSPAGDHGGFIWRADDGEIATKRNRLAEVLARGWCGVGKALQ